MIYRLSEPLDTILAFIFEIPVTPFPELCESSTNTKRIQLKLEINVLMSSSSVYDPDVEPYVKKSYVEPHINRVLSLLWRRTPC